MRHTASSSPDALCDAPGGSQQAPNSRPVTLPRWSCYCPNTTQANALCFNLGRATVYYSYDTPVAIETAEMGCVVRQNEWGPTTGKHLNAIDGGAKKDRIPGPEFEQLLHDYQKGAR